jgi:signal peptidase II
VILLDQLAKLMVVATVPLFSSVTIIPNLLDITYVRNTGLAYGFLQDSNVPYKSVLVGALAVAALGGILVYARQMPAREKWSRFGLSLILAGAIGNILDRVRLGYVIDYVDVYWRGWHFWAFNVADAAISVGAVFVFADILKGFFHAPRTV